MPTDFDAIYNRAASRKGGEKALESLLARQTPPLSNAALKAIPEDRWLATMTRCVFNAGFNWRVIDQKWSGFEQAFEGFNLARWHMMSEDDLQTLVHDTRIVRHGTKIRTVQTNASFLIDVATEHGSVGAYFTHFGPDHYVDLLFDLKKRGGRMGGKTAQYFLRRMGLDSFIFSRDGVAALVFEGIVDTEPTSKTAMRRVQEKLTKWRATTGRSLTEISRILAYSTDAIPEGFDPLG